MCNKLPQIWWHRIAGIYPLTALESRCHSSKCPLGHDLYKGSEKNLSLLPSVSGGSWQSLALAVQLQYLVPPSSVSSVCVFKCLSFSLIRHPSLDLGNNLLRKFWELSYYVPALQGDLIILYSSGCYVNKVPTKEQYCAYQKKKPWTT